MADVRVCRRCVEVWRWRTVRLIWLSLIAFPVSAETLHGTIVLNGFAPSDECV